MRTITLIVLCAVTLCFQNEVVAQAPKGTGRIIVIDTLGIDENFTHAMLTLIDDGYEIETFSREFGTITTKTVKIPGINSYYYLYLVAGQKQIVIMGKMKLHITDWSVIDNRGMKDSPIRAAFEEMEPLAKKLGPNTEYDMKTLR